MTYFNSLVYVVGLIFCLHFVVEKKLPFIRMLIFSVIYACIHYFMMIDGMFDANQYILVIISIVMLDWLMLCWLYDKVEFWILFYSTIYFGLYMVGQNIVLNIFAKNNQAIYINVLMNCGIVLLFIVLMKKHLFPKREIVYEYAHLFNMVNIFVLLIYMIFFGFQLALMKSEYIVLIDGLLLYLWLYLLYTMNRTFVLNEEKTEFMYREVYNQNIEQYVQYYLQDQKKSLELMHDFKNHLMIIERLDDFNKIHEYIREILGDIQSMQSYVTYGNIYVDACLNMKVQEYKNLQFHFSVHIDGLKMNGKDLCALLFNLLDNSAQAASQCQGEVDMSMIYNEGNLVMSMKNDCLFEPDYQSHSQFHGYGLKIIQSIVDKYNGAIEYRFEQQKVCVDLCIQV